MTERRWAAAAGAAALVMAEDFDADEPGRRLDGPDGHHLARVRRLTVDEHVVVSDGRGRWYESRIVGCGRDSLTLERIGATEVEPEPTPAVAVAFAPAKRDHGVEVTHQLVELGVDRIVPLLARRGVVRWTGDKARDAVNRLRRVAREAAMQAHRARIPEVDDPVAVAGLAGAPGLVVAERAEVHPGAPWDPAVAGAMASEWLVVIGPEGGFDPGERALLAPAARLTIGPHVLRAVTAPVAAAALLVARRS